MKQNLIYEDDEIEVYVMPNYDEIKQIILNMLKEKGALSSREAHDLLPFPVSEDKIRKILDSLVEQKIAKFDYRLKKYILIS